MSDKTSYLIVNFILGLTFLLGFFYLIFSESNLVCYYKDNYNILCSTCGLTRDFKSILKFEFESLINSRSLYFFLFFSIFFLTRIISTLYILKNINLKKVFIYDCIIVILIAVSQIFFSTFFRNFKNIEYIKIFEIESYRKLVFEVDLYFLTKRVAKATLFVLHHLR